MGAKTWMLVYADGSAREALLARPTLDRDATARFAATLFPGEKLEPLEDGDLMPPEALTSTSWRERRTSTNLRRSSTRNSRREISDVSGEGGRETALIGYCVEGAAAGRRGRICAK